MAVSPKEELPVVSSNQKFSAIFGETITKLSPRYGTRTPIVKRNLYIIVGDYMNERFPVRFELPS